MLRKYILSVYILIFGFTLFADDFQKANQLYSQNKFKEAAILYEQIISEDGNDVNTLFNLGNSYENLNKKGRALYNLYKAQLILPSDNFIKDEIKNLEEELDLQNQHPYPLFISYINIWYLTLILFLVISIEIFFISFFYYKERKNIFYRFRKFVLSISFILFLITLSGTIFYIRDKNSGIVYEKSSVLISPYPESEVTFTIREGSKVKIEDEFNNFYMVSDMNDRYGWIDKESLGKLWKK